MKRDYFEGKLKRFLLAMIFTPLIWGFSFCQNNQSNQQNQDHSQKQPQVSRTITPAQTSTIKEILSKYNSSTLTAIEAKAIHEKFRASGIHAGPETRDAIRAAGFDPEKLRTLDPPPDAGNQGKPNPPSASERMSKIEETIIKPLSPGVSQKEAIVTAYKDFFTELENLKRIQKNPGDPIDKSKVEPLEKKRDEKIKQVLSDAQYKKYKELEKSSRPPRPDEPGQK